MRALRVITFRRGSSIHPLLIYWNYPPPGGGAGGNCLLLPQLDINNEEFLLCEKTVLDSLKTPVKMLF